MIRETLEPDFAARSQAAETMNAQAFTVLFAICAAILFVLIVFTLKRRLWPKTELIIDQDGLTSGYFRKRRILWREMTELSLNQNFLTLKGKDANGSNQKVYVAINQLTEPARRILGLIESFRPDLFARIH
jgi:hypothetical protein